MDPGRLDDDGLLALVGLVRVLLHTDDQVSAEEQDLLASWQALVGQARWNQVVVKARATLSPPGAAERLAEGLTADAAQTVRQLLWDLAQCDEVTAGERRWLLDLDQRWQASSSR